MIRTFQHQTHVAAPVGDDDHRVLAWTEQAETRVTRLRRGRPVLDRSGPVLTSAGVLLRPVVSPHQPAGGAVAPAHAAVVLLGGAAQLVVAAHDLEPSRDAVRTGPETRGPALGAALAWSRCWRRSAFTASARANGSELPSRGLDAWFWSWFWLASYLAGAADAHVQGLGVAARPVQNLGGQLHHQARVLGAALEGAGVLRVVVDRQPLVVPVLEAHVGVSRTLLGPEVSGLRGAVLSPEEGEGSPPVL